VAWPLLITNVVLLAVTQADLWIMGAFRSQHEVAVYGAAARVVLLVAIPLQIANAVVPPLIAEMYAQGRTQALERVLRATATLAGIPAFLVLAVFVVLGEPVLGVVYGGYYSEGAAVLALLSLGQLVNVWVGSCGMTLGMTGRQSTLMVITVVWATITVAVGLGVVDRYGATGVAAAAAAGLALQNLSTWLVTRYATGMWTHARLSSLPKLIGSAIKGMR
jgi:O-antigen/teichoic acid export membrane protein